MRKTRYETESWRLTIGTLPGYGAQAQPGLSEAAFAGIYDACAEAVYAETGVYISANAAPARALYRREWGCPEGGEPVYLLSGVRNPQFHEAGAYEDALERLIARLKEKLGQSTIYLERWPVRFDYYQNDET